MRLARRNPLLPPLGVLVLLAGPTATIGAEVYRWVDEQGVTQLSETPPLGRAYDKVGIPTSSAPEPDAEARTQRIREQTDDWLLQNQERQEKRRVQAAQGAERRQNCQNARQNLATLENLGARRLKMPDGTYTRPSEKDLDTLKQQARQEVGQFCD